MSEKSTNKAQIKGKTSRRRDDDPVKITGQEGAYRVSWYPSGVVGKGEKRRQLRFKTREAAEACAREKYVEIRRHSQLSPDAHQPLGIAFRSFIEFLRANHSPSGTVNQYRSNWNCHVPEEIAGIPCGSLNKGHWTAIFDSMLDGGASKATIQAVNRTLSSFLEYAENHNYFGDSDAFGLSASRRKAVVKRQKALARQASKGLGKIGFDQCPSQGAVHRFANFAERVLPGYGLLLVFLSFATGMRINECLGLRIEHANAETGEIKVEQQLDRYNAWPATAAPKSGCARSIKIWGPYLWVLRNLVAQAELHTGDHAGWLFPPDRKVKGWSDRVNRLMNQDAVALHNKECTSPDDEWRWTFHWLRHSHASYSLMSRDAGGLGRSVAQVQAQLGHQKPTTTMDTYIHQIAGDDSADSLIEALPWEVEKR